MSNILILDGDHKNTLAIIRFLGKKGEFNLDTLSHTRNSICFYSKYVNEKFIVQNPKTNPTGYVKDLKDILMKKKYLLIIPVSFISFQLCSQFQWELKKITNLIIADFESIQIASNKNQTYDLAENLGIPYPKVYTFNSERELMSLDLEFPLVIKAPLELGKNLVKYVNNIEELKMDYGNMIKENEFNGHNPVVQKFIIGDGVGFFAYYKNGKCENYFMHRRVREYPCSGGSSVVAEAYNDKEILANGKKILDDLKWEGVAMVEFKKDNSTGMYNLMEINAKFWGSLDLALVCGADFPGLMIDSALGKEIVPWTYKYKRFQWILNGDLFHLLERPWIFFKFIKDIFQSENDIWLTDIKPNLFQIFYIPVFYFKKWFK